MHPKKRFFFNYKIVFRFSPLPLQSPPLKKFATFNRHPDPPHVQTCKAGVPNFDQRQHPEG